MKLRPYQEQAVTFIYERDRSLVLAPVGAGKTALTLTAMKELHDNGHVNGWLVIAPKRVCTAVWPVEGPKWVPSLRVELAVGTPAQRATALASGAPIVVVNYDNLQWLATQDLNSFDGIVFDELTKLKNPSGLRFKAFNKIIDRFKIRIGLTGSFTSNGLEDVFGQCKVIDQTLLGRSKGAFLQQYFHCINRDFGEWTPAAGALAQVMERIKPATFVLDAGEYKDKLPPLHTVVMNCAMNMTNYKAMKKNFMLLFPDTQAVAANAGVVTAKLQQLASGFVYAEGKATKWMSDHKFQVLDDLLSENQHANTIIAYQYQAELAELQRRYPRAVTLDEPDAIDRWNKGRIELLLVHPKSAGHGLNLQHGGSRIVFLALPWSLELYEQTIGRLHRSGQTHDVWCYVLLTEGTVDEKIYAALHDKKSLSQLAMEALK